MSLLIIALAQFSRHIDRHGAKSLAFPRLPKDCQPILDLLQGLEHDAIFDLILQSTMSHTSDSALPGSGGTTYATCYLAITGPSSFV